MAAAPLDLGGKAAARIRPRACRAVGDLLSGCRCHGVWRPLGARRHQRGGRHPEELGGGTWMARRLPGARRSAAGRVGRAPARPDLATLFRALGRCSAVSLSGTADSSGSYLVDSASSHMLVSKIKPCMSKYRQLYSETANGSLNQLSFI